MIFYHQPFFLQVPSTTFNKIFILLNRQFINKTASRRFSSGAPAMPHGGSVCTDELSIPLPSLCALGPYQQNSRCC